MKKVHILLLHKIITSRLLSQEVGHSEERKKKKKKKIDK